jgi:hypothetical protein
LGVFEADEGLNEKREKPNSRIKARARLLSFNLYLLGEQQAAAFAPFLDFFGYALLGYAEL